MLTTTRDTTGAPLTLQLYGADGTVTATQVTVTEAYNFGYAARDRDGVAEHVDQMRAMGLPAPRPVPAIFPIPPRQISTAADLVVAGDQTYGEVEFALINSAQHGWLVTIGSDHTDLEVEKVNMPKAKGMCPDVIGAGAWRLDDVADVWDRFTLTMWARTADGERVQLQHDTTSHLLAPRDIIAMLEQRRAGPLPVGTVIMSGTIAGEPTPGKSAWSARLEDPQTGRNLQLSYTVQQLDEEI